MLKKYLDTVFYFFSFSLVFFLLIFSTNYKILSYLSIILIISIDILMYIVGDYERNIIKQKQSADICLNELKKQKDCIEIIKQKDKEIEKRNHDLKKVIGLISELLEQKQYKSAQEWICKLQNNSNLFFSYTTYSNHTLLNALLNSKVELCKSNNIDVKCLICGKIDGIDDIELYCLMVNLLDNAIEAAKMSETPYISLFVNASETEIMGEIINSIKKSNYKTFEDIPPKEYSDGHGYGMININEIIKKNNGNINYCLFSSNFVKVTFTVEKKLMTK